MSNEISNKELAEKLFSMSECHVLSEAFLKVAKLAAERLEAMPDEPVGSRPGVAFFVDDGTKDGFSTTNYREACECANIHNSTIEHLYRYSMPDVVEQEPVLPKPTEADAMSVLRVNSDGSFGQADVEMMMNELNRYHEILLDKVGCQQPAPDKETIKRYCLEFLDYRGKWISRSYAHTITNTTDAEIIDEWLQQQSAEGEA